MKNKLLNIICILALIILMPYTTVLADDNETPVMCNCWLTGVSSSQFTVNCAVYDNVAVTRAWFNVYGPGGSKGYEVSVFNNFEHTIKTSDYGGAGMYSVHVYLFDAAGNQCGYAIDNVMITDDFTAPVIMDFYVSNVTDLSFTLNCTANEKVTRVWYNVYPPSSPTACKGYASNAYGSTSFSHTINTADYDGTGQYEVHIYVWDSSGNESAGRSTGVFRTDRTYYLDLNGILDGKQSSNILGYGTADIYINGELVADDVYDYYSPFYYGTNYVISDIKSIPGHTFQGLTTENQSGVLKNSVDVKLKYETNNYFIDASSENNAYGQVFGRGNYLYGAQAVLNAVPQKGYSFLKWSDGAVESRKIVDVVDNRVYSAFFAPNKYIVDFDANGGDVTQASKEVVYAEKYGELPVPSKAECTFEGWYTEKNGGNLITEDDIVQLLYNIMLYAHWKEQNISNSLDIDTVYFTDPDTLVVTIKYEGKDIFKEIAFPINYDNTCLELINVKTTGALTNNVGFSIDSKDDISTANIIITETDFLYNGDGNLMDLIFKVSNHEKVQSNLSICFPEEKGVIIDKYRLKKDVLLSKTIYNQSLKQYTVSFETNGGNKIDNIRCDFGTIINAVPVRDGYNFGGWYTDEKFNNSWTDDSIVFDDIILYAKWIPQSTSFENIDAYIYEQKCTAVFDVFSRENMNNCTIIAQIVNDAGQVAALKTKNIDLSEMERRSLRIEFESSDFMCSLGNMPILNLMMWCPFNKGKVVSEMGTFEIEKAVEITLRNVEEKDKVIYKGKSDHASIQPPEKEGYIFEKWINSYGVEWKNGDPITENLYLYAVWKPKNYIVNFHVENGKIDSISTEYNSLINERMSNVEGYTFDGWYTDEGIKWNFNSDKVTADLDLYARWSANYYNVSFDTSDGTPVEVQRVMYGDTAKLPDSLPEKTQHKFINWNASNGLSGALLYSPETTWDFINNKITKDTVVYAGYDINKYTVSFNSNGGTSVEQQVLDYGSTIYPISSVLNGNTPSGWYSFDTRWDWNLNIVENDIVLYASWD